MYRRVIPRDLFNEAKLLNCLGRLALLIEDRRKGTEGLRIEFDGAAFDIGQDDSDASLRCYNFRLFFRDEEIDLYSIYNSRTKCHLMAIFRGEHYYLLDNNGNIMPDFTAICASQSVTRAVGSSLAVDRSGESDMHNF